MKCGLSGVEKASCFGCLLGLVVGFVLIVFMIVNGAMTGGSGGGGLAILPAIIILFGVFFGCIPMAAFGQDKNLRFASGCICYPLLIITGMIGLGCEIRYLFGIALITMIILICVNIFRIINKRT